MTPQRPPRLATALLRRLGPVDDAIAGDLLEGFQRRSAPKIWYWWQVGVAIQVAAAREIRTHLFSVLTCIAIGWMSVWVLLDYVVFPGLDGVARVYSLWRLGYAAPYFGPFTPVILWVFPSLGDAMGAAVAVRVYRGQRSTLALLYAVAVLLRPVGWLTLNSVYYDATTTSPHYTVSFAPLGLVAIAHLFGAPFAAALTGGAWAASRARTPIRGVES